MADDKKPKPSIAEALHEVAENMLPLVEAAEGQRALLESRGWSPTAAEQYALTLLLAMVAKAFS